jgi:hypothetical protein
MSRLYDGHDTMDLQPNSFPGGALDKARTSTCFSDLPARPWILSRRSCEWHRHSDDKRADHDN